MQDIEKVLEKYKDMVRFKAKGFSILGCDEEDLIQEGMIALVSACKNFKEDGGASFETFANRCIENRLINVAASANKKRNLPLNEAASLDAPIEDGSTLGENLSTDIPGPEDEAIYSELLQSLKDKNSDMFSKQEHEILNLLLEGKEQKEIAVLLNKTGKQINNACVRIRNKITGLL